MCGYPFGLFQAHHHASFQTIPIHVRSTDKAAIKSEILTPQSSFVAKEDIITLHEEDTMGQYSPGKVY